MYASSVISLKLSSVTLYVFWTSLIKSVKDCLLPCFKNYFSTDSDEKNRLITFSGTSSTTVAVDISWSSDELDWLLPEDAGFSSLTSFISLSGSCVFVKNKSMLYAYCTLNYLSTSML
jgi:hypothetical protein